MSEPAPAAATQERSDVTGDQASQVAIVGSDRETPGAKTTLGYLYVDLRGLPDLIQRLGAHDAATTLFSFGEAVRTAVAGYPGTEIRSEGDSYFCVCPTAAAAVEAASTLLRVAPTGDQTGTVTVACGLVAGSGLGTAQGYIQAARLGTAAPSGTVLLTDEVRRLAPKVRLAFQRARSTEREIGTGRRLWIATPVDAGAKPQAAPRRMGLRTLVAAGFAVALVTLLALGAVWLLQRGAGRLPPGPWTIAAQLPLSGPRADLGATLVNAVQLAINETNGQGGMGGQQLVLDVLDEGTSDRTDIATASIDTFVSNDSVVGLIGPLQSPHGAVDIPVTNAAGLLECSPANSNPKLTKPRFGALDLRSAYPDRINYVRVFPSDDIQGPAAASFVFHPPTSGIPNAGIRNKAGLDIHRVLVVDDTSAGGRETADSFESSFEALGGTTVRRAMNPGTTDFTSILAPLDDSSGGPWAVYFGGIGDGGAALKQAMVAGGHADVPLVSWDGLFDGSGSDDGSYINLAGPAAANSYVTQSSIAPARADFGERYLAAFGADPNPYAAAGYACTQVVIDALAQAAREGADASGLREAVRAYAVNPANRFDTALGSVSFDANGDSTSQYVTLYAVDTGANGGTGDWVYLDQQDFGPAP